MNMHLTFRIGVFYKDEDWMEKIFAKVIRYIGINQIPNIDFSLKQHPCYIKILGTSRNDLITIYFIKPEIARGYKFDRIYYQADLDDEAFNRMLTTAIGNIPRCIYEDVEVR